MITVKSSVQNRYYKNKEDLIDGLLEYGNEMCIWDDDEEEPDAPAPTQEQLKQWTVRELVNYFENLTGE